MPAPTREAKRAKLAIDPLSVVPLAKRPAASKMSTKKGAHDLLRVLAQEECLGKGGILDILIDFIDYNFDSFHRVLS